MKRSIILSSACYLSIKDSQLVVQLAADGSQFSRHLEDYGMLMLEHPQITLTHGVLQALAQHNVVLVSCDRQHRPCLMTWPLDVHHTHGLRARMQLESSLPVRKQIWRQTVVAKIRNQAAVLKAFQKEHKPLLRWADEVQSGDATGREGVAAKFYFQQLMGSFWSRDPDGEPPNGVLNYGYTIIRAAMARAIVAAGMLPILGVQHHNKYNSYPLADDLMEPYRPFVDFQVMKLLEQTGPMLSVTTSVKQALFAVLTADCVYNDQSSPLQTSMENVCANAAKFFCGETKRLVYPVFADADAIQS